MKNKIIAACVVVFSAIVLLLSSNLKEAEANDRCAILPFNRAFENATAVFVGEVLSEKKEGDTKIFEFELEKYWKGAGKKKVVINIYETPRYQAWFKVGGKYLVYAVADENGNLHVGRCSRSKDADDASEDLGKLGEGKRPK
jgi:hypothetical protein